MHAARRSPVWVFDLDDTLHHATPHIFPHINRAMTAYLQRHLGLDERAAGELRRHYWTRYGATLIGPAPVDLGAVLRIADAGDVADPDGPAGESALRGRVRDLSARSDLVVALCVLELLSAVHLRKDSRA